MLGVVQSIQIGEFNGDRQWSSPILPRDSTLTTHCCVAMAALIVADKILALHPNHNRSKNWKKEVVLLTHGEQDEVCCTRDLRD